jgi:transcription initiation factor IIE alpha subunit
MKFVRQARIREVLKNHPDGLSSKEIAQLTGLVSNDVRTVLRAMPDVYVDRWAPTGNTKHLHKVWMVAQIPENCPHPKERKFPNPYKTEWREVRT